MAKKYNTIKAEAKKASAFKQLRIPMYIVKKAKALSIERNVSESSIYIDILKNAKFVSTKTKEEKIIKQLIRMENLLLENLFSKNYQDDES